MWRCSGLAVLSVSWSDGQARYSWLPALGPCACCRVVWRCMLLGATRQVPARRQFNGAAPRCLWRCLGYRAARTPAAVFAAGDRFHTLANARTWSRVCFTSFSDCRCLYTRRAVTSTAHDVFGEAAGCSGGTRRMRRPTEYNATFAPSRGLTASRRQYGWYNNVLTRDSVRHSSAAL
jgi:hypothetical protein